MPSSTFKAGNHVVIYAFLSGILYTLAKCWLTFFWNANIKAHSFTPSRTPLVQPVSFQLLNLLVANFISVQCTVFIAGIIFLKTQIGFSLPHSCLNSFSNFSPSIFLLSVNTLVLAMQFLRLISNKSVLCPSIHQALPVLSSYLNLAANYAKSLITMIRVQARPTLAFCWHCFYVRSPFFHTVPIVSFMSHFKIKRCSAHISVSHLISLWEQYVL